jgi:hypothetical protein
MNNVNVRLVDASGRAIRNYQYNANGSVFNQKLDITNLHGGLYYVLIYNDDKLLSKEAIRKL